MDTDCSPRCYYCWDCLDGDDQVGGETYFVINGEYVCDMCAIGFFELEEEKRKGGIA